MSDTLLWSCHSFVHSVCHQVALRTTHVQSRAHAGSDPERRAALCIPCSVTLLLVRQKGVGGSLWQHAALSCRVPCNAAARGTAGVSDPGNAHLTAARLRNAARTPSLQPPGMLANCSSRYNVKHLSRSTLLRLQSPPQPQCCVLQGCFNRGSLPHTRLALSKQPVTLPVSKATRLVRLAPCLKASQLIQALRQLL